MKLPVPFVQLPLLFDAPALAAEIAALGEECWRPHPQGYPGNSMLPLVAVNGDPADERFAGVMQPTRELARCPYLMQAIASLGVVVGRSRLMRLSGHAEVSLHVDQGYYWVERMRVHVPVVTQPTVRFECGDGAVHMAPGECWIFDTWRQHRVLNDASQARIHLVVDTVGGDRFSGLLAQGRGPGDPWPGQAPQRIAPGGAALPIAYEHANVPAVMTPWELDAHLAFLCAESLPHPQLEQVRALAGALSRSWRNLWASHGDAVEGRPLFRAAMQRFVDEVRGPAQAVTLRNELSWFGAMMPMISRAAVSDAPLSGHGNASRG